MEDTRSGRFRPDLPSPPVQGAPERTRKRTTALSRSVRRRRASLATALPFLLALLLAALLLSLAAGAVPLSPRQILRAVTGIEPLTPADRLILLGIRLPRTLASSLVGAALASAGLLFQGLFRNPLADPYILGASGGSLLGAAVAILLTLETTVLGFSSVAAFAFAGALLTMLLVYRLARSAGRTSTLSLLLAGFAVSTILGNSTYVLELLDTRSGTSVRSLNSWLRGFIATPTWSELGISSALLAFGLGAALLLASRLDVLALGDDHAHQLGLSVERTRLALILVGSLLTSTAVALGGLIGFAGLIVPHVCRLFFGPGHLRLLPVTAVAGALFLVLADTLARSVLAPTELPVGVLMTLIGGPFFLVLLARSTSLST